jgi:membrane associated rhomboid family serine protease
VVKLLITQFINTALIYFILSKIIPKPVLSTAGIVLQVSSLIVVSGFIQILTNAAHIGALMRSVLLWWKYSNVEEDQPIRKFQVRLNKEF